MRNDHSEAVGETPQEEFDDPRIVALSQEYLRELEAGKAPNKEAYLAQVPDHREELEECLDGVELAYSLSKPTAIDPFHSEFSKQPLGDFKIVRELGRGGMGTVYEAVQLSLGRRVALKVLPFAAALDERQRQRFQLESHAAANLHHPNIVPVYAVGFDRGIHYYAMQLINGMTLARLIDQLRGSKLEPHPSSITRTAIWSGSKNDKSRGAGEFKKASDIDSRIDASRSTMTTGTKPSSGLSETAVTTQRGNKARFEEAARLVAEIADALEYAHTSGIIHRDVKPANILIDGQGKGWITDFGLAHVHTNSVMTQTGELLGTLRYMSPEQASGKSAVVDQRSDVYSLGATLYELLCLQPIFPGQDRHSLFVSILNQEPQSLRSIDRSIPIELETICLKATRKSPSERYATAAELAADLRRYLSQLPIKAKRPTALDYSRKWIRRNPVAVVSSIAVLACATIGLSIAMTAIAREQLKTSEALAREQSRALIAEKRLDIAQKVADDMISIAEFDLSDNPMAEGIRKRLLEAALVHYNELIEEQSDQPEELAALKVTQERVARILLDLSAMETLRQSFLLRERDVLEELAVTEEQGNLIRRWLEQNINAIRRSDRNRDKRDESLRSRILEIARSNADELNKILTPEQLVRLKQITLQFEGMEAFHSQEVISRLGLTQDQREQIRKIESEFHIALFAEQAIVNQYDSNESSANNRPGRPTDPPGLRKQDSPGNPPADPPPGPPPGPPREGSMFDGPMLGGGKGPRRFDRVGAAFSPVSRQAVRNVEAILSEEQLSEWKTMTGPEFEGSIGNPMRNGSGPATNNRRTRGSLVP